MTPAPAYRQTHEFGPSHRAAYCGHIIEIPTPQWTTDDGEFFGAKRPQYVPASIQERAYTSAIWYTPAI